MGAFYLMRNEDKWEWIARLRQLSKSAGDAEVTGRPVETDGSDHRTGKAVIALVLAVGVRSDYEKDHPSPCWGTDPNCRAVVR
jgi:hypothetical protein